MPAKKIIFCPFCGFRIGGPLTSRRTFDHGFASFWKCGALGCLWLAVSRDLQRDFEPYLWGHPIQITNPGRTRPYDAEELESIIQTTLAMFQPPVVSQIPDTIDRVELVGYE
jgi:hypothetical protein